MFLIFPPHLTPLLLVIPTDVRVVGILRIHHFRTEGALVGHGGALEVLGLHVTEDVFPTRGGESAEQTDVAASHRLLPHPRLYDPCPVHRRLLYKKASFNADPDSDPAFYLKVDPDPGSQTKPMRIRILVSL